MAIGPRSAGTDGSHRAQDYITQQLKGFGCPVDPEPFHTPTPLGDMEMKNIVAKIPGSSPDIVLFLTHYDTKRLPNFVGADDGGSSTGVMLELAHLLCARKNALTIWIAFLDGEEAFNPTEWKDPDNTYGSRELAARMALSGDLARTKAVILADMVGGPNLRLQRESNSTGLADGHGLVYRGAAWIWRHFCLFANGRRRTTTTRFLPATSLRRTSSIWIHRMRLGYWHTPQDTLDKVSPRSLARVGHVLIAVVPQLEQKFAAAPAPPRIRESAANLHRFRKWTVPSRLRRRCFVPRRSGSRVPWRQYRRVFALLAARSAPLAPQAGTRITKRGPAPYNHFRRSRGG